MGRYLLGLGHLLHGVNRACFLVFYFPDPPEASRADLVMEFIVAASLDLRLFDFAFEGGRHFRAFLGVEY